MTGTRKLLLAISFLTVASLCLLSAPPVLAQRPTQGTIPQGGRASLTVYVRLTDGSPFDQGALVTLQSFQGGIVGDGNMRGGSVVFDGLQPGRYTLEIFAAGYKRVSEGVEITALGENAQTYIVLTPESAANPSGELAGPPILAPRAQKELTKAFEALRASKPEDARKHLQKAARNAAGNADVNYAWGMYYAELKDWTKAKGYWNKAIQIYPKHAFSLAALGQAALLDGNGAAAVDYFGRAAEAMPSSWRFQELLAESYFEHQEYEQAQKYAEHAIELGKERASLAQLVLAKALLKRDDPQRAKKALELFLAEQPAGPRAEEATRILDALRRPPAETPLAQAIPVAVKPPDTPAPSVAAALVPAPKWLPPDVDESMPAVEAGVACPMQRVQDEAGKRIRGFVDAVNRIAATERLNDEVIDPDGLPSKHESRSYSYVASIQETRPRMYTVEEYRNGTTGLDVFPGQLATLGLPSLVMVFHPAYRDEYEVTCEGLSRWHGALAWQVHFRQRPDKPARLREYRIAHQNFPVRLRGRAWIAADTFQIVSLETDMVAPISRIRLNAEHISIEYMPVRFRKGNQDLWLPQSAEIFVDLGGRRIHRLHRFSNYLLFSVDDRQKIATPSAKTESDSASQANQPNP